MDQLNIVFDTELAPPHERFGLVWEEDAQPEQVITMAKHLFPSLKPLSELDIEGASTSPTHYIIEGDNYHALTALNMTHRGRVDAIYIDPPYNTEQTGLRYTDRTGGKTPTQKHSRWLSFMYHRLRLTKDLLTDDGVLFISIDDREMAHLKLLCDGIFSAKNFIGNFVWVNRTTPNDAANRFATDHEYILVYARQRDHFRLKGVPKDLAKYVNRDDDPRGPWMPDNPSAASGTEKDRFPIKNPHTGEVYYPPAGRYWAFAQRRVKEWTTSGKLVFPKEPGKKFLLKKYRADLKSDTKPASSLVQGILTAHGTKELKQLFGSGSPIKYPKPVALLQHLLGLLDKRNGIFLDFFAGSGTLGHAILNMNREDGGQRSFVLCNNNENNICREVLYPRIRKLIRGYTATATQKDVLYQKKISINDLAKGSDLLTHLSELTEHYRSDYDKVRRSLKNNTVILEGVKKGPATVKGSSDSLRYYQTLFLPPQDLRIRQACADLVAFKESTFVPVQVHLNYHAYRNDTAVVIVCFEGKYGFEAIAQLIRRATQPVRVYVFHEDDYRIAQDKFTSAVVAYVPLAMKQLFTT
jgi:adenine-specific DNA-methyltransferase